MLDTLLVSTFIVSISTASISNYKTSSLILKAAVNFFLLVLIFLDFSKIKNKSLLHSVSTTRQPLSIFSGQEITKRGIKFLFPVLLLFFPLLSLIYSSNPEFGLQKWMHLLIGIMPLIFAVYYFISILDKERYKKFLHILIAEALLCSIFILILSPFTYDGKYAIFSLQWSHVIVGRFLSLAFLLTLFYTLEQQDKRKIFWLIICLIVLIFALTFTGLRAALLGIAVIIILINIIYFINRKKNNQSNFVILQFCNLAILLSSFTAFYFFPSERFENLTAAENLSFRGDGAILSRLDAWESAWEMIKEKPLLGYGLGGYKTDFPPNNWIKYPHNIFLEIQVELGLTGTILFLLFLYKIFRLNIEGGWQKSEVGRQRSEAKGQKSEVGDWNLKAVSLYVKLFFVFALILAAFSKDYATQTLLWISLPVLMERR